MGMRILPELISKGGAKVKFCYETKEEAWKSFGVRKYAQFDHLRNALKRVNIVLNLIKEKEKK